MSIPSVQTHFVHTVSPAHHGTQGFLHQDINLHLANPAGQIVSPPLCGRHHIPLTGQTHLSDFGLQKHDGFIPQ
jgi:hypothetical protein